MEKKRKYLNWLDWKALKEKLKNNRKTITKNNWPLLAFALNVNTTIENSIGSISTKYWDENQKEKIFAIKDKFNDINSYGSIGCEYFDIALEKRDFTLLSRLHPWDHIPGVFIVRQAGGHDCHFDKLEYRFYENSKNLVVSGSKKLSYAILNLIGE